MLPSQRVPQRLQILIIKRHQPHVGIEFERDLQHALGDLRLPELAKVAGDVERE